MMPKFLKDTENVKFSGKFASISFYYVIQEVLVLQWVDKQIEYESVELFMIQPTFLRTVFRKNGEWSLRENEG